MLSETFFVGANYWASHAGTFMWRNWDEAVVERDFKLLHENGLRVLRVFPLWSDFQKLTDHRRNGGIHREFRYGEDPLPDTPTGWAAVDPEMLERFRRLCRLAEKYDLRLIVGLITGWMSGRLYAPPALEHRDLLTDPAAIQWEVRFVRCFVRELKNEKAIAAWDWGNECNCLASCSTEAMWLWGSAITAAIRAEDAERIVISGLSNSKSESIQAMGEVCDMLTAHSYAAFCPHGQVDFIDSFRSSFQAAVQTRWTADLGKKPAFIEEIGSFGPTFTTDAVSGDFVRNVLWNSYAHDCRGLLWWCANDQNELAQTPYDWNSMERELGLLKTDGTPKPILRELAVFGEFAARNPLPPHRRDAVVIQCVDGDHWGVAYMTFLLAKQAGFDVRFHNGIDPLPDSRCYLLPSAAGTQIMPRHRYLELLRKVEEGATLYYSSDYCGIQPFDGFGVEIRSVARAAGPGKIIAPELHLDLTVPREFELRTGNAAARILARDAEGRPVLTAAGYGRGKLIFLALSMENALAEMRRAFGDDAPRYAEIYRIIAREAGIRRTFISPDPMVTVTEHPADAKTVRVAAVNNSGVPKTITPVLADRWRIDTCLVGTWAKGALTLAPHSGALLTLSRV